MVPATGSYFHLHLVSDSTGETLITVARAVAAQYANVTPVEHVYPLVRSQKQLDRVLDEIEEAPGIVLFTLLEKDLVGRLEAKCQQINIPSLSIIGPVMQLFQAYLGAATTGRVGAQHTLNAEYFKRIDALNYSMMHDDGQHVEGLEEADVVLVGVSRTSKTPTSIYLANRGVRTANVPLVPGIPIPHQLETLKKPLVVSLHATPERLIQVRQNRLLSMGDRDNDTYIDRQAVTDEVAFARRLSAKFNWALLDVTRRSIEETAAAIMKLVADRQRQRLRNDAVARKTSVDTGLAKPRAANAAGQCRHRLRSRSGRTRRAGDSASLRSFGARRNRGSSGPRESACGVAATGPAGLSSAPTRPWRSGCGSSASRPAARRLPSSCARLPAIAMNCTRRLPWRAMARYCSTDVAVARMTMRRLGEAEIDAYLDRSRGGGHDKRRRLPA